MRRGSFQLRDAKDEELDGCRSAPRIPGDVTEKVLYADKHHETFHSLSMIITIGVS